jgi:hypothetical protein
VYVNDTQVPVYNEEPAKLNRDVALRALWPNSLHVRQQRKSDMSFGDSVDYKAGSPLNIQYSPLHEDTLHMSSYVYAFFLWNQLRLLTFWFTLTWP